MIHNVFHVSMLHCYRSDPSHVISPSEIEIQPDMTYNEEPIRILAREVKQLRNKKIALVKVLWQRHSVEEAIGEPEEAMRKQYLNLFTDQEKRNTNLDWGRTWFWINRLVSPFLRRVRVSPVSDSLPNGSMGK
ncbi:receptor-like protein kinase [Gossypium australe]|uniref:Receptor-like protein kinase n=1 Tax=Gossypium australe TaxID=47621 RepID=A0A5B6VLE0_9ROSI|nr:receptor-like protein kinase [Gossypium australe]